MTRAAALDAATLCGLPLSDYREITRRLGRDPNPIEARMFGVMWSEHCGYKHSRAVLRRFATSSPRVLGGPGENAGVVSIGAGWALAFKMESHNHPSAVDPYNGAATGVGGIIRDILAMGARPVALLDSLRFGPLQEPRARRLCAGVVAGIAGYGNAVGVPTVGGELHTAECYRDNPLVNVACLGLVREDQVARSAASGPGSAVLYVGARTGRDGIGGASFASTELDEGRAQEDRASVQMGDPFTGKLLIEATLEALATGAVTGIQDMGAAGLTCAMSEMAARGRVGMQVDLERVPLREARMRPDEILLSESQERMLLVVRAGEVERAAAPYRRWGLAAEVIGRVTEEARLRITHGGRTIVDLPPEILADAPIYAPAAAAPEGLEARWRCDPAPNPAPPPGEALLLLLRHPDVASKRCIYRQYDHMVGVRTVTPPGSDAAVLRLIDAPPLGLALTSDGGARWCASDPRRGAALSVLEAAANLACAGAEPLGVTDCLNFGNPERAEVFWTFREAVEGIAEACEALGVPVIGGNVSFYNEAESEDGPGRAVFPTPVVGMAGLLEDVARAGRMGFAREGDLVVLLGAPGGTLGASLYQHALQGEVRGRPSPPDLPRSVSAITCAREAARAGVVSSLHDVSDGGIAVALAEACIAGGMGAAVTLHAGPASEVWFGEGPARFVASLPRESLDALEALAHRHDVPIRVLGRAGGSVLRISQAADAGDASGADPGGAIELSLAGMAQAWESMEV